MLVDPLPSCDAAHKLCVNMTTLRVMTYNIWDVPFIATARKPRMKALADALRSCEYDVIGLEVCICTCV